MDPDPRARVLAVRVAVAILLVGPTVLAFFAGGYFVGPRVWAGLVAWALAAVGVLISPHRSVGLRGRGARVALVGLGLLAAWTLLSVTWAPIPGSAYDRGEIVGLYLGAMLAATTLLRARAVQLYVEPMLAAGTVIVIGYGLSERLLPGLLHFASTSYSQGRLEQPLTYWNAMGEVAAIGFVLCARIAGDIDRPPPIRLAAAAACAPLGIGLYLTLSRGALFACVVGVAALIVAAPRREQLHALVLCVCTAVLAALVAVPLSGAAAVTSSLSSRERHGLLALVLTAVIATCAALLQRRSIDCGRLGKLRLPPRAGLITAAVVCAGLALVIVAGANQATSGQLSGGATRLVSTNSIRYAYWRVALRAFAAEPLRGVGAGGWAVLWHQEQPSAPLVQDAHSLPLQTLAELGLVGAGFLVMFVGGVALAAHDGLRTASGLAPGSIAGFVVYIAHAPLDWDWEMPAVTLIAIVLAGALAAVGRLEDTPPSAALKA